MNLKEELFRIVDALATADIQYAVAGGWTRSLNCTNYGSSYERESGSSTVSTPRRVQMGPAKSGTYRSDRGEDPGSQA